MINDRKLLTLIDKNRISQAAAARRLDVSRQAVSKRLQELRGKTTRVICAKKVEQAVDSRLDAVDQLQKITTMPMNCLTCAWPGAVVGLGREPLAG